MTRPSTAHALVSILTPSLRSAQFIGQAIDSVQQQDYPCVEHIIVDGGSDDGTPGILARRPGLTWISEPDAGQSSALNKALRIAGGEIVGWLNADDAYAPHAISTAAGFLMQNPDVDAVYGDLQMVDADGKPLRLRKSRPFDLAALFLENFINQPTVFVRKTVIERAGGLDESLHYSMDRELWLRIGSQYKFHYIPDWVGANFRLHVDSKTARERPAFHVEWLRVMEQACADPRYANVPRAIKRMAIQQAQVRLCVATMQKAARSGNTRLLTQQLMLLVTRHWDYILTYPRKRRLMEASRTASRRQNRRDGLVVG